MKRVKKWFRAAWGWIVGALVLFGVWLLSYRWYRSLGKVRDALAFEEAASKIKVLRAVRATAMEALDRDDEQILQIDKDIASSKRTVIEAFDHGRGLSDQEVLDAFAALGV